MKLKIVVGKYNKNNTDNYLQKDNRLRTKILILA